ncbi:MAG TPA: hypothetical protein VMU15_21210 [Anaeromyxobacter sp.]|nr:hypothetical protein [Anaeromyxobacter sp.]
MKVQRELFYRCIFSSPDSRLVAHVRAWDADEAAQLFQAELRTDGVEEHGTIEVVEIGAGAEEAHAAYP